MTKEIISHESSEAAWESVRKLKNKFDSAETQEKKLRIFKLTQMSERKARRLNQANKTFEVSRKYRKITNIYKGAKDDFGMRVEPCTLKYARMKYRKYSKNRN